LKSSATYKNTVIMSSTTASSVQKEKTVASLTLSEKEEIVGRFNERVDGAIAQSPPSKEWVKQALSRGGSSRCPCRFRRLSLDIILHHGEALADLLCEYPDDIVLTQAYDGSVGFQSQDIAPKISPLEVLTTDARWKDEWGTEWGHAVGGSGATTLSHPLTDWSQLENYLGQFIPDPNDAGRLDGAMPSWKKHAKDRFFCGMTHLALFERLHCIRGMSELFMDFHLYPDEINRLLDVLTDYYVEIVRLWGQLGSVDGIFLTDDWGTQTSLMISPIMWKKFFAERYRRICEEAHRHNMLVVFHSCGNVMQIIGGLIEAGVDVMDPIQPDAMNIAEVAKNFGGKIAFSGGISDQILKSLSPQQIRDEVRRTKDILGGPYGNAFLLCPSNVLLQDIPLENLRALIEAGHSN
jgi:uroporphyrinogen decarboxylase